MKASLMVVYSNTFNIHEMRLLYEYKENTRLRFFFEVMFTGLHFFYLQVFVDIAISKRF